MATETSKARPRRTREGFFDKYIQGAGIDIGYGGDLVHPTARGWDIQDGDAQFLPELAPESFDYVYSSHCLEHLPDPPQALARWWDLVKPNGFLIIVVPDEDLYEQGYWPSVFNTDHKATFSASKSDSWSPVHYNLTDMVRTLPNHRLEYIRTIDTNYNHHLPFAIDQSVGWGVEVSVEMVVQKLPTPE
jgi:SAM-dependent methyltransferase